MSLFYLEKVILHNGKGKEIKAKYNTVIFMKVIQFILSELFYFLLFKSFNY